MEKVEKGSSYVFKAPSSAQRRIESLHPSGVLTSIGKAMLQRSVVGSSSDAAVSAGYGRGSAGWSSGEDGAQTWHP